MRRELDKLEQFDSQKAEIEKWEGAAKLWHTMMQKEIFRQDIIRADAIKEFAERVQKYCTSVELNEYINTLVEEMVGDGDG